MIRLTPEHLEVLAPTSVQRCRDAFANADDVLARYAINDKALRLAHFMAQILHESGGLCIIEENLSYSAKRMMQIWPKRFPTIEIAKPYAKNPKALANRVYGGRMGNSGPDDGWLYIGRGLLQITGKESYQRYGTRLGCNLVGAPKLASDPQWSLSIAAEEWTDKGCNELADQDDITTITKRINGGLIGFEERKKWLVKTKKVWVG
ncbi:MAG TPA: lytic enzyme [Thermoanaerobaculia bacterium]|nr:lytic enzyme [Thermoanaerobaculia bacterium]